MIAIPRQVRAQTLISFIKMSQCFSSDTELFQLGNMLLEPGHNLVGIAKAV